MDMTFKSQFARLDHPYLVDFQCKVLSSHSGFVSCHGLVIPSCTNSITRSDVLSVLLGGVP